MGFNSGFKGLIRKAKTMRRHSRSQ